MKSTINGTERIVKYFVSDTISLIDKVIEDKKNDLIIGDVRERITTYLSYIVQREGTPQNTVEEFLAQCGYDKNVATIFETNELKRQDSADDLIRIEEWVKTDIINFIDLVLKDSENDPQYSAVTANNRINVLLTYIATKNHTERMPREKFFLQSGYSNNDFSQFEKKRIKESKYYIGEQRTK